MTVTSEIERLSAILRDRDRQICRMRKNFKLIREECEKRDAEIHRLKRELKAFKK